MDNPYSSNPVSTTPPIPDSVSEPSQQVSDNFWSQTTELLDRVKSRSSITITKVSSGSPIEKSASQSRDLAEAPEKETLTNETASVYAIPPVNKNPTPKVIGEPLPLDSSKEGENWQQISEKYRALLNLE